MTTLEQQLIDDGYMDGKKSFECLWAQIEANFDFERVCKVMDLLKWKWHVEEYGLITPTIDRIKMTVKHFCYEAWQQEKGISTGGFTYRFKDNTLLVEFTVEEWVAE